MFSPQTIEILGRLDKNKLRKFGDFLLSPYFNKSEPLVKMFDIIYQSHPSINFHEPDFAKMFKKFYPGKSYSEQTIKNLYSEFGSLLKKFIGYEEIENEVNHLDPFIVTGLSRAGCYETSNKFIKKRLNTSKKNLGLSEKNGLTYFKTMHHSYKVNLTFQNKHSSPEYFELRRQHSELHIIEFLHELYFIAMEEAALKKSLNITSTPLLLEYVLENFDIKSTLKVLDRIGHPYALNIKFHYWLYYYTVNDISEKQFKELKAVFMKIIGNVNKESQLHYIARFSQLIGLKLIPKDKKYYREIFELGKLFAGLKLFPDKNLHNLGTSFFRDFFTTALVLNEFDWAERFINEYGKYLNPELRENEINYRKGILFFKRKKYELSLDHLNKMKETEINDKINIRFYYMMNYIELKAYESALSVYNSMRQFYNDTKQIPEMLSGLIQTSLKYFHEIIKCEEKGIKIDGMIYKEANDGRRYYHKQFILEKMEKLR
jgi:tetratricopeptide (TPR) repeat protein